MNVYLPNLDVVKFDVIRAIASVDMACQILMDLGREYSQPTSPHTTWTCVTIPAQGVVRFTVQTDYKTTTFDVDERYLAACSGKEGMRRLEEYCIQPAWAEHLETAP